VTHDGNGDEGWSGFLGAGDSYATNAIARFVPTGAIPWPETVARETPAMEAIGAS
jgi:hypothetical protein